MITNIAGVDLIAVEAKYHANCRACYVSKSNLKHQLYKDESEECAYEKSFQDLMSEVQPGIAAGKAYNMNYLRERYQQKLASNGITSSEKYRSEKLKRRMLNHFGDEIVFHKQPDPSKPELV